MSGEAVYIPGRGVVHPASVTVTVEALVLLFAEAAGVSRDEAERAVMAYLRGKGIL